jgi:cysteine desulfurase / selenocysteine lyase
MASVPKHLLPVWRDTREDFPVFTAHPDLIYLDSGATSMKPQVVIDAISQGYGADYATVHRGVYRRSQDMTERYEAARAATAHFINGQPRETIFVRGATEAINLVADSWGRANIQAGDEILLTVMEHHSNLVPWQMLAAEKGAILKFVPLTDTGDLDYAAAEALINPRTKLIAITHVSNVLGTVVDIARIVKLAKSVGAKTLVDGCQAAPRLKIDVATLGCDFYVFSGHKLYGPTGIGVLWGKYDLLAQMPPWQGGGAMIETVSLQSSTFLPPPQRFEAGTPHIVGALGLHAAINYVNEIGIDEITRHESALVAEARRRLGRINSVRIFGPEDGLGCVSFAMGDIHPHDIGTILDEHGINIRAGHHCAQPLMEILGVPATARVSFGLYSTMSDIDALEKGLASVARIFQ